MKMYSAIVVRPGESRVKYLLTDDVIATNFKCYVCLAGYRLISFHPQTSRFVVEWVERLLQKLCFDS